MTQGLSFSQHDPFAEIHAALRLIRSWLGCNPEAAKTHRIAMQKIGAFCETLRIRDNLRGKMLDALGDEFGRITDEVQKKLQEDAAQFIPFYHATADQKKTSLRFIQIFYENAESYANREKEKRGHLPGWWKVDEDYIEEDEISHLGTISEIYREIEESLDR